MHILETIILVSKADLLFAYIQMSKLKYRAEEQICIDWRLHSWYGWLFYPEANGFLLLYLPTLFYYRDYRCPSNIYSCMHGLYESK